MSTIKYVTVSIMPLLQPHVFNAIANSVLFCQGRGSCMSSTRHITASVVPRCNCMSSMRLQLSVVLLGEGQLHVY